MEDIPDEQRQDPLFARTNGVNPGRDGCRVPLPWSGDAPPFGFSPEGASAPPWLPQPASWRSLTVAAQQDDPGSMLWLYRTALRLRRGEPALGDGSMRWLDAAPDVLAFARTPGFACVLNMSTVDVVLPEHESLLVASGPLRDGRLPPDTAVWLRTA